MLSRRARKCVQYNYAQPRDEDDRPERKKNKNNLIEWMICFHNRKVLVPQLPQDHHPKGVGRINLMILLFYQYSHDHNIDRD